MEGVGRVVWWLVCGVGKIERCNLFGCVVVGVMGRVMWAIHSVICVVVVVMGMVIVVVV